MKKIKTYAFFLICLFLINKYLFATKNGVITTSLNSNVSCSSTTNFTISGDSSSPSYYWQSATDSVTGTRNSLGLNTQNISISQTSSVLYYRRLGSDYIDTSNWIRIILGTIPVVNNTNKTICSGTSTNIIITSTVSSTYSWTLGTNTGSITGASSGTIGIINQILSNSNNSVGSIVYNITPVSIIGQCLGSSTSIVVFVNPIPIITNSTTSQTVCSNISLSIPITSTTILANTTYTWSASINNNITNYISSGTSNTIGPQSIINPTSAPQSLMYTIIPTYINNAVACLGSSFKDTITINPKPIIISNISQTICGGVNSIIPLTANTIGGSNTFTWSTLGNSNLTGFASNGTSNQIGSQTIVNNAITPQILIYSITPTYTFNGVSCIGLNSNYTDTINPTPILTISQTSQTICSGVTSSVTLFSNTSGGTNSFSWRTAGNLNLANFQDSGLSNQIGNHFIVNNAHSPQSLIYAITPIFTLNGRSCFGTISNYTYFINPLPSISSISNSTNDTSLLCNGSTLNLTINTLDSNGLNEYTWSIIQSNVSGATAQSSYSVNKTINNSIANISNSNLGTIAYTITPRFTYNSVACYATISKSLKVLVLPRPISTNLGMSFSSLTGDSITKCSGVNFNTTITNIPSGSANKWQWTVLGDIDSISGDTEQSINSNNILSQTLSNSSIIIKRKIYSITPSYQYASYPLQCNSINARQYISIILPKAAVSNSLTQTICSGVSTVVPLTANTTGGSNTFSWITLGNSNLTGFASSGSISQIGNHTILNDTIIPQILTYSILPKFTYNNVICNGYTSNYNYTINPKPIYNGVNNKTICSGNSTSVLLSSNTKNGTNSFSWTTNLVAGITGNSNLFGDSISQKIININNALLPIFYKVIPSFTNNNIICKGDTANITVNINPRPNVFKNSNSALDSVFCSGQNSPFVSFGSNVNGTNFTWKYDSSSNFISNCFKGDSIGNFPSFPNLLNQSNTQGFAYYLITPISNNCIGYSRRLVLVVNPKPVYNSTVSKTICSLTGINIKLNANTIDGINSYNWTTNSVSNILGNINGNGDSINQILVNSDSLSLLVKYNIVPTFKKDSVSCNGDISTIDITVNAKPIYRGELFKTICSGFNSNINLNASTPSNYTNYTWTSLAGINVKGNTNSQSNSVISDVIKNTNKNQSTVNYYIEPNFTFGGKTCVGNIINSKLYVNPLPDTVSIIGNFAPCLNSNNNLFYPQIIQPNIKYSWFSNNAIFQNGVFNDTIYIKWPNIKFTDTLKLVQTNSNTYCTNTIFSTIQPTLNVSPNTTNIKRIGNSDILVCEDITDSLSYQWGFYNKKSLKDSIFQNGNLRYIQLPNAFDTINYIYWVKTFFTGQEACFTKSYFNKTISLGINNTNYKNNTTFSLYPNPSNGNFYIEGNLESINQIEVFDSKGQIINFEFDLIVKKIIINDTNPNGLYFFVFNNLNSVVTKKVVIIR